MRVGGRLPQAPPQGHGAAAGRWVVAAATDAPAPTTRTPRLDWSSAHHDSISRALRAIGIKRPSNPTLSLQEIDRVTERPAQPFGVAAAGSLTNTIVERPLDSETDTVQAFRGAQLGVRVPGVVHPFCKSSHDGLLAPSKRPPCRSVPSRGGWYHRRGWSGSAIRSLGARLHLVQVRIPDRPLCGVPHRAVWIVTKTAVAAVLLPIHMRVPLSKAVDEYFARTAPCPARDVAFFGPGDSCFARNPGVKAGTSR